VWKRTCSLLLVLICVPAPAEVPHLRRVDAHIYRGRQPKAAAFTELRQMGIKTVLDLRGGMFHKPRERKLVEAAGMRYISIRLSGIFEPKDSQIARILAILEDPAQQPIFVHCRRGDDRVGMVIACYRIAHDGWTNQQALAEARRVGISRFEILMRRYIEKFDPARLPQLSIPPASAAWRTPRCRHFTSASLR
jgi:tyrosine-protein phosphatase SIW14